MTNDWANPRLFSPCKATLDIRNSPQIFAGRKLDRSSRSSFCAAKDQGLAEPRAIGCRLALLPLGENSSQLIGRLTPRTAGFRRRPVALNPGALSVLQPGTLHRRQASTCLNHVEQVWKKRVVSVDLEKSVVSVRPAADEPNCLELAQLVLNSRKSKSAHPH
jgi:hypothetical protein